MHRYLLNGILFGVLMDKKNDEGGGGGGAGEGGKGGNEPDYKKELADEKAARAALEKRLEALEAKGKKTDDPQADDPDLKKKADDAAKAKEKQATDQRAIESALKFSLGAKDWLKTNASLLPKDIGGIFEAAEKENYGTAIEKDGAIKSAVIQKFFEVQANLDLLTTTQKSALDEFLKLTKNAKQEQSQKLYDQIFEPTFEMLKRLEKAKQLRTDGHANTTDSDQAYRDKMIKLSRQHYLGEKANA